MKQAWVLPVVLLPLATGASAQSPEKDKAAVLAVVTRMFDGMREADSTKVRSVFDPGARFSGVHTRQGETAVSYDPVDGWIAAIARSNKQWEERIFDTEVRVDGNIASVWTRYNFYLNGALRHCGVDSMELLRTETGWKITQLSDTQQREGCKPEPK
jgi:hypothetical protein